MNDKTYNKDNVLVIGDLHAPFIHNNYLEFCLKTQRDYDCGTVIFIGDIADFSAISFHDSDPNGYSAGNEYDKAIQALAHWQKAFPEAIVLLGNHDLIPARKLYHHGLPQQLMPKWQQIFNAPDGWKFARRFELHGVVYLHGTTAAEKRAQLMRKSVVQGHLHSELYVKYFNSDYNQIFAVQTGCGIDVSTYAFKYGKDFPKRPILGCAVILESGTLPLTIPMAVETKEDITEWYE